MLKAVVDAGRVFMSNDLFQKIKDHNEFVEMERVAHQICDEIDEDFAKVYGLPKETFKKLWSHSSTG